MAFDLLVRNLWTDSGVSAGLAKLNNELDQLGRSGPGARTGLRLAETGMRTLAFEAAGVAGPLGRVAAGLLSLGGGNALVLGAAAGIGIVAAAYKFFTADAVAATKAQEDFLKSLEKTPQGAATFARNALQAAQENLAALTARFNIIPGTPEAAQAVGLPPTDQDMENARLAVAAAQNAVNRAEALAADAREKQTKVIEHQNDVLRDHAALLERLRQLNFVALGPLGTVRLAAPAPTLPYGQQVPIRFGGRPVVPRFIQDVPAAQAPYAEKPEKLDASRLAAEAVALLGALKQGGVGGILSAGGGILSDLSGLKGAGVLGPIGIVTTALGGLFSLFHHDNQERERREAERHRELIGVLHEGPQRITNNFYGSDGSSARYQAQREGRLGREPRLGG